MIVDTLKKRIGGKGFVRILLIATLCAVIFPLPREFCFLEGCDWSITSLVFPYTEEQIADALMIDISIISIIGWFFVWRTILLIPLYAIGFALPLLLWRVAVPQTTRWIAKIAWWIGTAGFAIAVTLGINTAAIHTIPDFDYALYRFVEEHAVLMGNLSLCRYIYDPEDVYQTECAIEVIRKTGEIERCPQLFDWEIYFDQCVSAAAAARHDTALCDRYIGTTFLEGTSDDEERLQKCYAIVKERK